LNGIDFLHSKDIWHRDIKPANIFLHRNELELGDLGLARNQQQNYNNSLSFGFGTPFYTAPEIVNDSKSYNEKIDIWYIFKIYNLLKK
jgi:serine/threonine protein kinase